MLRQIDFLNLFLIFLLFKIESIRYDKYNSTAWSRVGSKLGSKGGYLHNRMETQRKKQGFSWKRQNRQSWVLRPILKPFEISRRYTRYVNGLGKAWGIQPYASLEVEKSRTKNGKLLIFIFPRKESNFSKIKCSRKFMSQVQEQILIERNRIRCKMKKLSLFLQSVPRLLTEGVGRVCVLIENQCPSMNAMFKNRVL